MKSTTCDLLIIGAGPAGFGADRAGLTADASAEVAPADPAPFTRMPVRGLGLPAAHRRTVHRPMGRSPRLASRSYRGPDRVGRLTAARADSHAVARATALLARDGLTDWVGVAVAVARCRRRVEPQAVATPQQWEADG